VLARLVGAGLLDDEAFAHYWVENREEFKPRARRLLRYELEQKGLESAAIAEAVEEVSEEESAYRAGLARAARYAHLDRQTFRARLGGFLQRRGFSYEVVNETVNRLWRETNSERLDEDDMLPTQSGD